MDLNNRENGVQHEMQHRPVKLEEALDLSGFGLYSYLIIIGSSLSMFCGLSILLAVSYVLPATDCEMHLTPSEKGILASMAFTGVIFSSHFHGYLSDKYGRRKVLIYSNYACSIMSILAVFSPNAKTLAVISFINGFVAGGLVSPSYVYLSEFFAFEKRAKALMFGSALISMATIFLPGLAWIVIPLNIQIKILNGLTITSWRVYIGLMAVPSLICNLLMHFLHESPKYLLSRGRKDETMDVLKKIYSVNNRKSSKLYPVTEVILDDGDQAQDVKNVNFLHDFLHQTATLFKPPYLLRTSISCSLNLGIQGSYSLIMLWLPELISRMSLYETDHEIYDANICQAFKYKEEIVFNSNESNSKYEIVQPCQMSVDRTVYVASMAVGIAQFLFFGVMSVFLNILSKKILIVGCLLTGALSFFSITFIHSMIGGILGFGATIVLVGGAVPLSINITVESFPTYLRAMATCVCSIFGRLGASIGAELFGLMQENYCVYSYYAISGILIVISALCFTISMDKKK